jgi:hypothetical protein
MQHKEANAKEASAPASDRELVYQVARAALEVRRVERRLRAFNAGRRASNALMVPLAEFDAAVEALANFREAK